MTELEKKAKDFAIHWHCEINNQKYGNEPYSKHLEDVVELVRKYLPLLIERLNLHKDYREILLASAWLHDVVEDCNQISIEDIEGIFWPSIARVVATLTGKGSRSERIISGYYDRVRADEFAMFVKMCDRLANVKDAAKNGKTKILKMYAKEHYALVGGFSEFYYIREIMAHYKSIIEPYVKRLDEEISNRLKDIDPSIFPDSLFGDKN